MFKFILVFISITISFNGYAAEKYVVPGSLIGADKKEDVEKCNRLTWDILDDINFSPCSVHYTGKKYSQKKVINLGKITQLKGTFLSDSFVLTKDLKTGSRVFKGIACPFEIDIDNISEAVKHKRLDGIISILDNTKCRGKGSKFFDRPIVDQIDNYSYSGIFPLMYARYLNGEKWWSLQ